MIAMHYGFRLADDFDMAAIRGRVAEKGPLFDRLPGLAWKVFLCQDRSHGATRNEYGAFYVWQSVDAAHDFLTGPMFDAVIDSFGRPDVRLWVPIALDLGTPSETGAFASRRIDPLARQTYPSRTAFEDRANLQADQEREGFIANVAGLDPSRWEVVRFSLWDKAGLFPQGGTTEIFEVLHVSAPHAQKEHDLAEAS